MLTALNQRWTYEYDADGNRTKQMDANGNATPAAGDGTTSYAYDALDRLDGGRLLGRHAGRVSFAYDGTRTGRR